MTPNQQRLTDLLRERIDPVLKTQGWKRTGRTYRLWRQDLTCLVLEVQSYALGRHLSFNTGAGVSYFEWRRWSDSLKPEMPPIEQSARFRSVTTGHCSIHLHLQQPSERLTGLWTCDSDEEIPGLAADLLMQIALVRADAEPHLDKIDVLHRLRREDSEPFLRAAFLTSSGTSAELDGVVREIEAQRPDAYRFTTWAREEAVRWDHALGHGLA